ncbi:TPR and ankyrin repeat-containing protein 1-like [Vitis riparia]|uniref:TPR and ankyrin repeat-containing protein 1-like n=1 Tax=Vitis riparia TaxID=96939 RepID=UPI00155B1388|nr:TPR and ankyrin repeat-containing protein 1-like [Vitis riparia]
MNKINLVDSKSLISFPSFDEAKHNVLCSELKQLYVPITRTRQRLWICDIIDEVSKPMLEYWEKLSLIQVRCLHDLLAQGMQVASRRDEWRSQGFKLFYEHNYEMARLCFEKAGDMYNEKFARAASLQALANSISSSSPQMAKNYLSEAADMFEGIGKAEYAAKCFFEMRSYERAGRIYMEKCGEPMLDKAGECFSLARCYKSAAEAYAKGNYFSECLAVCIKGRLFYMVCRSSSSGNKTVRVLLKKVVKYTELNRIC